MLSRYRNTWGAATVLVLTIAAAIGVVGVVVRHALAPYPSHQGSASPPCTAGGNLTPSTVLVLSTHSPTPRVSVHVGDVVELSFPDWQGLPLRSPTQRPALTCALGPAPGGPSSTLLVRALRRGTATFYSGLAPSSGSADAAGGAAASVGFDGIVAIH